MKLTPLFIILAGIPLTLASAICNAAPVAEHSSGGIRKIKDSIIYQDKAFHCAFPSMVKRPDGELLLAFRRAPDRRNFGETHYTHTDPNSYLMLVRSRDGGETWTPTPELMYANPFGGSQDPCMVQLKDGSILCTTYGWAWLPPKEAQTLHDTFNQGSFAFLGGSILRSQNGGHTWQTPIVPPPVPDARALDIFGKPTPAFNRGAMCEGRNGKLYWVVTAKVANSKASSTHLMISSDKGDTWQYSCPVASDEKITFNESSLYETPKGALVAFMRSENFGDHTVIARSLDGGKSFGAWEDAGFLGHPHYALRLPDQRVLLVYGYRHAPMGVRARILDPECTDFRTAPEIILRDDGGSVDLGYPWAVTLPHNRVLVVYYFNQGDGTRFIGGTFLEIKSVK